MASSVSSQPSKRGPSSPSELSEGPQKKRKAEPEPSPPPKAEPSLRSGNIFFERLRGLDPAWDAVCRYLAQRPPSKFGGDSYLQIFGIQGLGSLSGTTKRLHQYIRSDHATWAVSFLSHTRESFNHLDKRDQQAGFIHHPMKPFRQMFWNTLIDLFTGPFGDGAPLDTSNNAAVPLMATSSLYPPPKKLLLSTSSSISSSTALPVAASTANSSPASSSTASLSSASSAAASTATSSLATSLLTGSAQPFRSTSPSSSAPAPIFPHTVDLMGQYLNKSRLGIKSPQEVRKGWSVSGRIVYQLYQELKKLNCTTVERVQTLGLWNHEFLCDVSSIIPGTIYPHLESKLRRMYAGYSNYQEQDFFDIIEKGTFAFFALQKMEAGWLTFQGDQSYLQKEFTSFGMLLGQQFRPDLCTKPLCVGDCNPRLRFLNTESICNQFLEANRSLTLISIVGSAIFSSNQRLLAFIEHHLKLRSLLLERSVEDCFVHKMQRTPITGDTIAHIAVSLSAIPAYEWILNRNIPQIRELAFSKNNAGQNVVFRLASVMVMSMSDRNEMPLEARDILGGNTLTWFASHPDNEVRQLFFATDDEGGSIFHNLLEKCDFFQRGKTIFMSLMIPLFLQNPEERIKTMLEGKAYGGKNLLHLLAENHILTEVLETRGVAFDVIPNNDTSVFSRYVEDLFQQVDDAGRNIFHFAAAGRSGIDRRGENPIQKLLKVLEKYVSKSSLNSILIQPDLSGKTVIDYLLKNREWSELCWILRTQMSLFIKSKEEMSNAFDFARLLSPSSLETLNKVVEGFSLNGLSAKEVQEISALKKALKQLNALNRIPVKK